MKAVVIHRFGGPEVLELAELEVPEPAAGQVRIRVQAAAVNPVDIATRAGWLADDGLMRADGQIGIGWDLAGVIDAVGSAVKGSRAGDPVIAMRDLLSASIGAQAEYVVLDTDAVAPAPRSVSPVEAATIPLNGLTATQALDLLALREGQWLLVTGAAGGVGGFALQLAALRGLKIVATASARDEPLAYELGATHSSREPRLSERRSAVWLPAGSTAHLMPPALACPHSTPSATAARSWPWPPTPRQPRCAAPGFRTFGSAPTLHASRNWPRSSTPADSPLALARRSHWTPSPPRMSACPPVASAAASSSKRPDDNGSARPAAGGTR